MNNLKSNLKSICLFFASISIFYILKAEVPNTLSIQGRLLDSDGNPKPDGSYNAVFKLYDSPEPGANVLFEQELVINLVRSIFNNELIPPAGFGFNTQLYLGIMLEGEEEMKPRLKLSSVPFSFYSSKSDSSKYSDYSALSEMSRKSDRATLADTAEYARNIPASGGELPVGTILPYSGSKVKVKFPWLVCDGSALSSTEYPELFDVVGTAWGTGQDDADNKTNFNLPDLRGIFLRGVDDGAGNDPDAQFMQGKKAGGNTGDNVGSYQNDASSANDDEFPEMESSFSFDTRLAPDFTLAPKRITNAAGSETRPKNASVYYIIKVK